MLHLHTAVRTHSSKLSSSKIAGHDTTTQQPNSYCTRPPLLAREQHTGDGRDNQHTKPTSKQQKVIKDCREARTHAQAAIYELGSGQQHPAACISPINTLCAETLLRCTQHP